MIGDILAPRASNRMLNPLFSSSRLRASNLSESDSLLVIEVKNSVYGAFVGLERIAIARDGISYSFQKAQGGVDVLVPVKRHEAAREEFRDHLAAGQAREHVAVSMLKNEDALQRSALR